MPKFNKNNYSELTDYLCKSCDHDATLETLQYDFAHESLVISVFNEYVKQKINFTFYGVKMVFSVRGEYFGDRRTINCVSATEDFSYLEKYIQSGNFSVDNVLYLVFETIPGDEIHIVTNEVVIDVVSGI